MRTQRQCLPIGLMLLSVVPALRGQEPQRQVAEMLARMQYLTPISRTGTDGQELWTLGNRFAASFHGGFRFAARDSERQVKHPLGWRTVAITIGNNPVTRQFHQSTRHTDWRCVYSHGAGITERYDVSRAGIEQSFLLPQRPKGRGDLRIVGQVETRLSASHVNDQHVGLVFRNAAGEEVAGYGRATAFDVDGKRYKVRTSWDGKRITLRIAESWLTKATFPLLIDPLFGARTILTMAPNTRPHLTALAIGHETISRRHNTMIAYSTLVPDADGDPTHPSDYHTESFVLLCNGDFTQPRIVHSRVSSAIGGTTAFVGPNNIAPVHGAKRWVVTIHNPDPEQVYIHDFGDTTLNSGQTLTIPVPRGHHITRPLVGGTRDIDRTGPIFPLPGEHALIAMALVRHEPFPNPRTTWPTALVLDAKQRTWSSGLIKLADSDLAHHKGSVIINQLNDGAAKSPWMVAWREHVETEFKGRFRGTLVRPDGSFKVPAVLADDLDHPHHWRARVAGGSGRYMLAFEEYVAPKPLGTVSNPGQPKLGIQRFDWVDSASQPTPQAARTIEPFRNHSKHVLFGLAFDSVSRSHWAITYATHNTLFGRTFGSAVRLTDDGSEHERQSLWAIQQKSFRMTAALCFDPKSQCFPIVQTQSNGYLPWSLRGQHFCYRRVLTPLSFGRGKGVITTNGKSLAGNRFFAVNLNGAPPNQAASLSIGTRRVEQDLGRSGMPGSTWYVGGSQSTFASKTDRQGRATVRVPLPKNGTTLYCQWTFADPTARTPTRRATSPALRIIVD